MEAVNRLAAGIAHEFNNVLQIVHGYVSFARDALPRDHGCRRDLEAALDATDRAAELASRLLQFARAEDREDRSADVNDAVHALQLLLRPIIGENIQLRSETAEDLPLAAVGDASIRQALLNLCVNARDAMPAGGQLTLETATVQAPQGVTPCIGVFTDQAYVRVSVSDNGEGIPDSMRASIFQPFFSTKAPGEGTGLGLPMVATCVSAARGAIVITSLPGKGSRFDLYLPIAEPDADSRGLDALPTGKEFASA